MNKENDNNAPKRWMWEDLKNIPGENFYNYFATECGQILSSKEGRIKQLSQHRHGKGYKSVSLYYSGSSHRHLVHRLVLAAYEGWEKDMQVNHKDHNKENNCVHNLEWVTSKQNSEHWNNKIDVLNKRIAELESKAKINMTILDRHKEDLAITERQQKEIERRGDHCNKLIKTIDTLRKALEQIDFEFNSYSDDPYSYDKLVSIVKTDIETARQALKECFGEEGKV